MALLRPVVPTRRLTSFSFFFFNDTATTEIYTLSLHDALPIYLIHLHVSPRRLRMRLGCQVAGCECRENQARSRIDRKSTRLNSSHQIISYAVFCLKKKNTSHINF